ncbi:endonuclease domain-containing protein [Gordonia sp. OPL2]|uniref:endonuclease domain-containing protein n=1 Tax=Gordonia sp. OPL2 TaxID=2486274 RepID=UPI0021CC6B39|nr:endonuclease domain-containing protein [Gordonia sp. OPL2]
MGRTAVLSDGTAAWWTKLVTGFPSQITVTTSAKGRHLRSTPGTRVRHRTLDQRDITVVDGLRVTTPALTVLEATIDIGNSVMDNALLLDHVTLDDLSDAHTRYPGRIGSGEARRLLAAMESGARSEAERVTTEIFRSRGIDGWKANHEVCGHEADFVFEESTLIVEIDGFAFHRDAKTFQRDRTKRNAWIAAGWTTLNFTWTDIATRADHVARAVSRQL